MPHEIDPSIKNEVNKEGFEMQDDESGAALLVGEKADMPNMEEKLLKEGLAENVESHIRLHKRIVVPKTELSDEFLRSVEGKPGFGYIGSDNLIYIDKGGNIAQVELPKNLVFGDKQYDDIGLHTKLRELGFETHFMTNFADSEFYRQIANYEKKVREKSKQKKTEEFDF